jgi:hypothetical protein
MTDYKIDFAAIPWIESAPGARYKMFKHEGKQIRLVEFRRKFVEPDWCRKGHIGYILEGQLEVEFADVASTLCGQVSPPDRAPASEPGCQVRTPDSTIFVAGDGVFIPAGEIHKHKARAVTEVVRLVLVEEV